MRPLEYIFTHCCICIICYENRKSNLFPAIMKKGHNFPIFFFAGMKQLKVTMDLKVTWKYGGFEEEKKKKKKI